MPSQYRGLLSPGLKCHRHRHRPHRAKHVPPRIHQPARGAGSAGGARCRRHRSRRPPRTPRPRRRRPQAPPHRLRATKTNCLTVPAAIPPATPASTGAASPAASLPRNSRAIGPSPAAWRYYFSRSRFRGAATTLVMMLDRDTRPPVGARVLALGVILRYPSQQRNIGRCLACRTNFDGVHAAPGFYRGTERYNGA